jgi:hypothetical protein
VEGREETILSSSVEEVHHGGLGARQRWQKGERKGLTASKLLPRAAVSIV